MWGRNSFGSRDASNVASSSHFASSHSRPLVVEASVIIKCVRSTVCLGQSHWPKDKVKKAEFPLSAWRLVVRLGPHKDKFPKNTHSARQPHLAGHPAPEIVFPA